MDVHTCDAAVETEDWFGRCGDPAVSDVAMGRHKVWLCAGHYEVAKQDEGFFFIKED